MSDPMRHVRLAAYITLALTAAGSALAAYASVSSKEPDTAMLADARLAPPLVSTVEARRIGAAERAFTGSVSARVQSNLGSACPARSSSAMSTTVTR